MTRQYVVGELSVLLGQLGAAASDEVSARSAEALRREAETRPFCALPAVTARAIALADEMCWISLLHGNVVAFDHQAADSALLYEFGLCSGLLGDEP
ncbi:hypothetical protein ACQHIV_24630 [Kribbella sp. GL6]|uniref:hypothetical protein n=1 Tax=Kribbella sp. GL6 TaxID=3419765 RepID=UPI003D03CCA8